MDTHGSRELQFDSRRIDDFSDRERSIEQRSQFLRKMFDLYHQWIAIHSDPPKNEMLGSSDNVPISCSVPLISQELPLSASKISYST